MARKSTFTKGSSTYVCECCGHLTRNTGEQSLDSKTCPLCWDLAGYENMEQDGALTKDYLGGLRLTFAELRKSSEARYAKALKSFDLIAHYMNDEQAETKVEEKAQDEAPVAATSRNGAVAICKMLFKNNPGITRKAFIALATEVGIHKGTAGTQYNRIKKEG